ncbi:MAG TPA: TatD family hydrolase [Saprospiraceae bacterium]|nr:TatD family hydrolase [Saprospiraceae bacterium]
MFIDTHAHIYSEEFKDDLENMLANAAIAGITDIYMPNIDSTSIDEMMRIAVKHKNCHAMMGLHPCYVKENYQDELAIVEKYLSDHTFAGVGEIGIDLYWDKTYATEQEIVFRRQIALAKEYGIPFVIHSRDSLDLTIDIVTKMQDGSLSGIFHCFNGTLDQAKRIMNTGFLMGIGGVITYKNAGVDKVVAEIPLEYIVLETDAPYLSPVPYRGKRNECAYISVIADKLAEVKGLTKSEIGATTTFNANKLFRVTP